MPEDYVSIQTPLEPVRRPLPGIVFCYLAGTIAGVWINGLHFITVLAFALFVLLSAFGFHCLCRLLQGKSVVIPPYQKTTFIFRLPFFARKPCGLPRGASLPGLAGCFVYLAVFLAGWLAINLRFNSPSGRDISALMDRPREGVEIIGIVADDPALRKGRREDSLFWSFTMRLEALSRIGFFQKARGEILVTMPQDENEIRPSYGERWYLAGTLIDKDFSSGFDGSHRMDSVRNRIPYRFLFQAGQETNGQIRLTPASPWNILHWCFILRQKCADTLARGIAHRPDVAGILQALLLGRRYELPAGMREAFVATGTYHIFAISGHHVAIIAIFVVVVLQVYGACRLNWFYYLAPVLIIFTIMAGMSTSAVRGCIMALMCFLGPIFKRKTDISSAMALAALLIVGTDPLQLFQAGFILSFGIVTGLIVLCPPLIEMSERRLAPDPYRLEPENWPVRNARNIIRWVLFMMTASFVAWLVSMPLAARWFNLVSLVALPANLLVIPLATLVLLAGCLSIVFGWCWPLIGEAFNFANVFFVSLMAGLTEMMARIPCGHIFVRSPPLWFVFFWFFTLVVWRIWYQKAKIWLTAVLILIVAGGLSWQLNRNEWEIHVLNVGHSAVCLVNTDKAGNLLLNTGPNYQARNVLSYLRKMGVNRLRVLACPIPDARHIGAAKEIIAARPVIKIRFGAKNRRARLWNELYARADKLRIGTLELTNKIWRIKSAGRDWLIGGLDGAGGYQKTDSAESFSTGPFSIFINSTDQAQMTARFMTARFLINGRQSSTAIDVLEKPEKPLSGFLSNEYSGASAEVQCRIVCSPAAENKDGNYCAQLSDFQPSGTINLGPGQGVLLRPADNGIEIKTISLWR